MFESERSPYLIEISILDFQFPDIFQMIDEGLIEFSFGEKFGLNFKINFMRFETIC